MHLDSKGEFVRTDMWREGKWVDMWSVVHFLSGAVIGFLPKYLGVGHGSAYALTILGLVAYEMFEALAKIEETPQNRVMDVAVGMTSFVLALRFHAILPDPFGMYAFAVIFALASALSYVGWRASQKAAVFEKNLRAEIVLGKEKIKTGMRRRKEKRRLKKEKKREARSKF